jgi:hypothetical protein
MTADTIVFDAGAGSIKYLAQVETGDIVTDYIATTTAAVSVGPVAKRAPFGLP